VHAEPITFGLKLAIWYEEAGRDLVRLRAAAEDLRVGKTSGAVGTFSHFAPETEELICARLNLRPALVASQVIQRDRHAYFVAALALATALCEKIALEVRHLQRTEVREAEEYFARTSAIRSPANRFAAWRGWSAQTCRRPSRTSRCGTSATSLIPRWNA
jgi:adenylosuccinate lyase